MYMGINLNAVQKFWPVKFILINARSTTVWHVHLPFVAFPLTREDITQGFSALLLQALTTTRRKSELGDFLAELGQNFA